jgi:hypothetical protein
LPRLLSIALVLVLLGGTAAAFAITEKLKLEKTPITRPEVNPKVFSPLSERGGTTEIDFRLRKSDTITVDIVRGGSVVATLATDVHRRKGDVQLFWDGRDEAGRLVPEGSYEPRIHLARAHRTITIPTPIQVDLTRPRISFASARPSVISPDHDGHAEYVRIRFRVDEPARALLFVDGHQAVRGGLERRGGKLNWFGRVDGRTLRVGVHTLALRAEDRAGNVSPVSRAIKVRIRYIALPTHVIHVAAGTHFRVRVETDAGRIGWRLAGRSGHVRRRTLRLRAPRQPGRYTLYVTANGHADSTAVVVRRRG